MNPARFIYVSYIGTTPEALWDALVNPAVTRQYWDHENVSDWKPGSAWEHRRCDSKGTVDLTGSIIESEPPWRLALTWAPPADRSQTSRIKFEIAPVLGVVRLTLTHEDLEANSTMLEEISKGWPMVLSRLKTLLETGKPLPKLW
jgi:uncharacterized protein YndB with AHSA1/START domain